MFSKKKKKYTDKGVEERAQSECPFQRGETMPCMPPPIFRIKSVLQLPLNLNYTELGPVLLSVQLLLMKFIFIKLFI